VPLGIDLTHFEKAEEKRDLLRKEIGAAPGEEILSRDGRAFNGN
jgi:hypothetical protein